MTTPTPIAAVADKVVDTGTGQNVPILTLRMGKILSVNDQDTSIDVGLQLSGALDENSGAVIELTGVKIIGSYVPVVGDNVWCLKNGADLPLVLGKVATSTPRGPSRFLQRNVPADIAIGTTDTNIITYSVTLDGGLYRIGMGWYGIIPTGTGPPSPAGIVTFGVKANSNTLVAARVFAASGTSTQEAGHAERVVQFSADSYTFIFYAISASSAFTATLDCDGYPAYTFIEPYPGTLTWLQA